MNKTDRQQPEPNDAPPDLNGAAIVNEDGSETPITEQMIQEACQELDPELDAELSEKAPDPSPNNSSE